MKIRKAIPLEELTKCTAIFVEDGEGHNFAIHEDDDDYFTEVINRGYETDDWEEFQEIFGDNYLGCDPHEWRKKNLK